MSSDTLIIILPLLALVLAGVSIAGLWYWWSSGQEGETNVQTARWAKYCVCYAAWPMAAWLSRLEGVATGVWQKSSIRRSSGVFWGILRRWLSLHSCRPRHPHLRGRPLRQRLLSKHLFYPYRIP